MSAADVTKKLADLLVKERELRAKMRRTFNNAEYEQLDRDLQQIERTRADLEDELEEANARQLARAINL